MTLPALVTEKFLQFENEVEFLTNVANCSSPKTIPAEAGLGRLFGCIEGKAQTAKLFVNEKAGKGKVANVQLMWNDWVKNVGHGLHADKPEAKRLLSIVLTRYASQQKQEIEKAFFQNKNRTFNAGRFTLKYSYRRGPAIDERLLVIEES